MATYAKFDNKLEPIPLSMHCCSQFGQGQRTTAGAYRESVRRVSTAQIQNGK